MLEDNFMLKKIYCELIVFFRQHIDVDDPNIYKLLTIWTMGTYIYENFNSYPYLYFTGKKESGKSRLLYLLSLLCKNPLFVVNITTASLFRAIEEYKPTFLIDEMEELSEPRMEELKLILQAGYKKEHGFVIREIKEKEDKDFKTKIFNVYCPKAIASIKTPDAVLESRCILIVLKGTYNKIIADTQIDKELANALKIGVEGIMKSFETGITEFYKKYDTQRLSGRDLELWKPLLTIAQCTDDIIEFDLNDYAFSMKKERIDMDKDTLQFDIIDWLLRNVKEASGIALSDIYDSLLGKYTKLTSQGLGKAMKGMGFIKRHTREGSVYWIDPYLIKDIALRMKIELKEYENEEKVEANDD